MKPACVLLIRHAKLCALLLAAALVSGCGPCPADAEHVLSVTREPLAAGTDVMAHSGTQSLAFDAAIERLKELDRSGKAQRYCGQRLAARPGVGDAEIVSDLSRQLGAGWLAAEDVPASRPDMRIYRWQSQCSARFYALMIHDQLLTDEQGRGFRPMASLYGCGQA